MQDKSSRSIVLSVRMKCFWRRQRPTWSWRPIQITRDAPALSCGPPRRAGPALAPKAAASGTSSGNRTWVGPATYRTPRHWRNLSQRRFVRHGTMPTRHVCENTPSSTGLRNINDLHRSWCDRDWRNEVQTWWLARAASVRRRPSSWYNQMDARLPPGERPAQRPNKRNTLA